MLSSLRRRWGVGLVAALVAMSAVVVTLALVPKAYTATAIVAFSPRPEARPSGDLVRLAIPTYTSLATSEATAAALSRRTGLDVDLIASGVEATNPPSSNTVFLSVTWSDPETAAQLADELANAVLAASADDILLIGTLVARAVPPDEPSWPPVVPGLLLGGLVALGIGVAAARIADRRRSVAATPELFVGLVQEVGLPVPVIMVGSLTTGVASVVSRAAASRLNGSRPTEASRIGIWGPPEIVTRTVAMAASAAAAIARDGRRVHLCLEDVDRAQVRPAVIEEGLAFTSPGHVSWGPCAALHVAGHETGRHSGGPLDVDVVLEVTDLGASLRQPVAPEKFSGVVAVVGAGWPMHRLEATLRALRELDVPVLAVAYVLAGPVSPRIRR